MEPQLLHLAQKRKSRFPVAADNLSPHKVRNTPDFFSGMMGKIAQLAGR
jgi:hypothetical protein